MLGEKKLKAGLGQNKGPRRLGFDVRERDKGQTVQGWRAPTLCGEHLGWWQARRWAPLEV